MISIIITAYKEPRTIGRAIEAIKRNKIPHSEIIVAAPDKETADVVKKYKEVRYFKDAGKGKSHALNQLFKKIKGDILILTDGDVFVDDRALAPMVKTLQKRDVGCVAGRPIALNDKHTMFGYFSHLFLDAGAHTIRKKLDDEGKFIECSGYLFGFKRFIKEIPTDVAEDSYIPYVFWKKGNRIRYVPEAKVYVKYPGHLREFVKQRIRTAKSHAKLEKYAPDFPRVKGFWNEAIFGTRHALSYPANFQEFFWTLLLFPLRAYIWFRAFLDIKMYKQEYRDAWERINSTK